MNVAANSQGPNVSEASAHNATLRERVAQAISQYANESAATGESELACVQRLLETVREIFDMDMVFLAENREYPYELKYVCSSAKEGLSNDRWSIARFPAAVYKAAIDEHKRNDRTNSDRAGGDRANSDCPGKEAANDRAGGEHAGGEHAGGEHAGGEHAGGDCAGGEASSTHSFAKDDPDSVLCFNMVEGSNLLGCLGFRCIEEHAWTNDEREACARVGKALFSFVAQRRTALEADEDRPALVAGVTKDTITGVFVYLDEDIAHAFKVNDALRKFIPEWGQYSSAINEYCDAFVTPDYAKRLRGEMAINALRSDLSTDNPTKSVVIHRIFDNKSRWIKFTAKLAATDKSGNPTRATLIADNITESVQEDYRHFFAMGAINDLFINVLSVNLTRDTYTVINDNAYIPANIADNFPHFSDLVRYVSREFVEPSFRDRFENTCDVERLRSSFARSKAVQHLEFKEKVGDSWKWMKLEIFASDGYDPDHQYASLFLRENSEEHAADQEHYAMLSSMESIYFALYTSSIAKNRFKEVIVPKDSRELLKDDKLTVVEAVERVVGKLVLPEYRAKVIAFANQKTMPKRLQGKKSISVEFLRKGKGWCRADVFPVERDENGNVTQIVVGVVDIDDDKRKELQFRNALEEEMRVSQEMEFRAEHDSLTQLLNRNAFSRIKDKFRSSSESLCFMLLDIDLFKDINDTYGHETGDECLIKLANLLDNRKRRNDFAFRFGGDEFALIFRNFRESNSDSIPRMVAQINESLSSPSDGLPPFSISAGASFSTAGFHDELYKQADEALYRVKQTHRGGCFVRSEKRETADGEIKSYRKSGFSETLYYFSDQPEGAFPDLLHDINSGLEESNGVGVACGFMGESMPIYFASKLVMSNLGYDDPDSFAQKAQDGFLGFVTEGDRGFYEELFNATKTSDERTFRRRTLQLIREDGALADFDELFVIARNDRGPDYWMSFLRLVRRTRKVLPANLQQSKKLTIEDRCNLALKNKSADVETKRILLGTAVSDILPIACLISLRDETFVELRNVSPSRRSTMEFGNARISLDRVVDNIVAPESRENMHRFVDLDTLAQRLASGNETTCDFQTIPDGSWFRARFNAVGFMGVDGYKYAVLFAESIDNDRKIQLETKHVLETTKKRLAERTEIINALASNYDTAVFLDYETDRYRMISDSRDIDAVAGQEGPISTGFPRVAQTAVVPEYMNAVSFVWTNGPRERRLHDANYLSVAYQDNFYGRSVADYFVISRDDGGSVKTAIFATRPVVDGDDNASSNGNGFDGKFNVDELNDNWRNGGKRMRVSEKDPLTQAYSFESMADVLEGMKDIDRPVVVIRMELSNLEQISARFGSALRDESLVKAYRLFRTTLGDATPISRITFNKFMAVAECENIAQISALEEKSQGICESLRKPQDGSPAIDAYIGIASSHAGYNDHLRRKSDEAVRHARNNGAFGTHVFNGSEQFNPHLSLEDWVSLGGGESEILGIMEGALCMQAFFVTVDLDNDTYSFYETKDLPPIGIPLSGRFSELAKSCTYLRHNDSPDRTMAEVLNPSALRLAMQNGRDHLTYEFTSDYKDGLWMNLQIVCTKRNDDEQPVELLCGLRDITEENRREELSEQLPQVLYHSAFMATGMINVNTNNSVLASGSLPGLSVEAGGSFNMAEYLKGTVAPLLEPKKRSEFLEGCAIETVLARLEANEIYDTFVSYKTGEDDTTAIVLHFRYLDKSKSLIAFAIEDITDRIEFDPITQKGNMLGFLRTSKQILATVDPRSMCVLYFNVKDFKAVNEAFGYSYGNDVLKRISDELMNSALDPLLVTRESGDHFYCLIKLDNLSPQEIERLNQMSDLDDGHPLRLHMECGLYPLVDGESMRKACDKARFATDANKKATNRPYVIFDESLNKRYIEQAEMFTLLQDAFARNEFVTYYQPIFDAKTRKIASAEALVRWSRPNEGIVSPGAFVPILEKRGLIPKLDLTVFDDVESFLRKRVVDGKATVPVSVNLSRVDIASSSTRAEIEKRIRDLTIDNSLIRLEITESAYIDTCESCVKMLDSLRERNTAIMIDDFGSGYSSLSTIAAQQFDIAKLDMSFVQLIGTSHRAEMVVKSSIDLCHSMNAKVVAEGVETEAQYEFLRDNDCDYIQGYLFSKPIDEKSFAALLDAPDEH